MIENHWQIQEAKNKFSSLVDTAQIKGPQIVTRHGKEAVVVLSIEDYKKLTKPEVSLIEFFKNSPLTNHNLDLERDKSLPREVDI